MSDPQESGTTGLVERIGEWIGYLFLVCVAVIGLEVIMRYAFNAPSIWAHETAVMLVAVCFAAGGAVALHEKRHINITALYDAVPKRFRRIFDVLIAGVSFAYLSVLAYAAWVIAAQAWRLGERSGTAWNPPLPIVLKTALLVSAAAMAAIAAGQLLGALRRLKD